MSADLVLVRHVDDELRLAIGSRGRAVPARERVPAR
jgi:hypothetical protein